MMFSLTLAYFPPFQTILSEVSIRFYLLRDVNLSVCLKWWLIFDTDNPVVFVISQASNVLRLHTLVFAWVSRARLVFLSNFLLNSFWINCSLPVACFLSFQTFLSNVLSRFHLLRDVNLSVCLKWWLTFDTENPVIFVTSQASNVLRLDSLIVALGFSGASCIYLTSLVEFKLHDGNLSVCLKWWLIFDTENPGISVTSQASNVLRLHTLIFALGFSGASCIYLTSLVEFKLHDGNLSVCMNRWFTVDTDNRFFSISNFFVLDYQLSMCTVFFSSSPCIPVQCLVIFVLDDVFINASLFSSVPNHSEWGFDSFLLSAWC